MLGDLVLRKSSERSRASFVGVGFVGGPVGVGEGVSGAFVDEDLDLAFVLGVRVANGVDLVLTDVVVGAAEVDHHGAGRLFCGELSDAAGVVADGAGGLEGEVGAAGCGEPADEAAIAEAEDADGVDDSLARS